MKLSFMNTPIKLNVYGKMVLANKTDQGWQLFFLSGDGKRRPANELAVPSFITEEEIEGFLSDLCHEWATDKNPDVFMI